MSTIKKCRFSAEFLAIIFSVFFAALAILITSGDNEFVRFLQSEGFYKKIIFTFKYTLILLFIGFILAISLFIGILPYALSTTVYIYPKLNFLVFTFIAIYSLFATANSSLDAIKYAEFRARFLEIIKEEPENPNRDKPSPKIIIKNKRIKS